MSVIIRRALGVARYTVAGVAGRLGASGLGALQRAETVPARRATSGGDPLDDTDALLGRVRDLVETGVLHPVV